MRVFTLVHFSESATRGKLEVESVLVDVRDALQHVVVTIEDDEWIISLLVGDVIVDGAVDETISGSLLLV